MKQIILFTLTVFLTSCLSYTSNQTGRTIGKSNFEINGSIDYLGQSEKGGLIGQIPVLAPTIGLNYGVGQNIDIGCRLNSFSHISTSFKYQFLGNKESIFASSIGVNGGVGIGEFNGISNIYNFNAQSNNSIHLIEENISVFFNPQYLLLQYSEISNSIKTVKNINTTGFSFGIEIGDKNKFSIGYTKYLTKENIYISNMQIKENFPSISIGFKHKF